MSTNYTNSYWSKTFTYGLERSVELSGSAGKTVREIKTVSFISWYQDQSSKMKKDQTHTTKLIHFAWLSASWERRACAVWHFCKSTAVRMNRLAHIAYIAYFTNWYCVYCVFYRSSFWNIACIALRMLRIIIHSKYFPFLIG